MPQSKSPECSHASDDLIAIATWKAPTRAELIEIHDICTQFEQAWSGTSQQTIESLLSNARAEIRQPLLEALIRSERELRSIESSSDVAAFHTRFPKDGLAVLRAFLPAEEVSRIDALALDDTDVYASSQPSTRANEPHSNSINRLPDTLGPYKILGEIARGGMGVIYRAHHPELDRNVALKVILAGEFATGSDLARFQTESQAAAALEHPNIVPVFEAGESAGLHYFSMPLIEGDNLADCIRDKPLDSRDAARIAEEISLAVQYAHERGIIHRDLKPRNILLDKSRSVRISDFGLAKFVSQDMANQVSDLTVTGQVIGTPSYMAPEQAVGSPTKLSDVYSIGAVLYALVTGRPPFQAATPVDTLRQVQDVEPVEPRRLNPEIPHDLETIILKCLKKNPEARYPTSKALAEDLQRFLDGKPVLARPVSWAEQLWRWTSRHPAIAGLSLAVFASLSIGLATSLWLFAKSQANEQLANKNFDYAQSTVKQYLTDVANSPELKEKGLETLRSQLLRTAGDFYREMQSRPTSQLKSKIVDAHYQLGLIHSELGDYSEAKSQFTQMLDLQNSLLAESPDAIDLQRIRALGMLDRAKVLEKSNALEDAQKDLLASTEAFRAIFASTHSPEDQVYVASGLSSLCLLLANQGRPDEEGKFFSEAAGLCGELIEKVDTLIDRPAARELVRVYERLALPLPKMGKNDLAERWFLESVKICEQLLAHSPSDPSLLYSLARAEKGLLMTYTGLQRFEDAEVHFQKANATFLRLTKEHPLVIDYLEGYAVAIDNYAALLKQRGQLDTSERMFRLALPLEKDLATRQPDTIGRQLSLGVLCSNLGFVLQTLQKNEEAESIFKEGLVAFTAAKTLDPRNDVVDYLMANLHNSWGNNYRDQKLKAETIQSHQTAWQCLEALIERNSKLPGLDTIAAATLHNLAKAREAIGDSSMAQKEWQQSLNFAKKIFDAQPQSMESQYFLANVLIGKANNAIKLNQLDQAEADCNQAIELSKAMVAADKLDRYHTTLGYALSSGGRIASAKANYNSAIDLLSRAIESQNIELKLRTGRSEAESLRAREALCLDHLLRARAYWRHGDIENALTDCKTGLQFDTKRQADATRAFYARLLVSKKDSQAAEMIKSIEDTSALDARASIDAAATIAQLAKLSGKPHAPRIIQLLKQAKQEPVVFAEAQHEPEFEGLKNWPEFQKLWQSR